MINDFDLKLQLPAQMQLWEVEYLLLFENCLKLNIIRLVLHFRSLENAEYGSKNTPTQIIGVM